MGIFLFSLEKRVKGLLICLKMTKCNFVLKSNLIDTVYLLVKIRYDNHIQNACESKAKGFEPYICLLKLVMNFFFFFFFLIRNIKISFDNIKY